MSSGLHAPCAQHLCNARVLSCLYTLTHQIKNMFKERMALANRRHRSISPSNGLAGIEKKLRSWEILFLAGETKRDYFICNSD